MPAQTDFVTGVSGGLGSELARAFLPARGKGQIVHITSADGRVGLVGGNHFDPTVAASFAAAARSAP